MKRNVGGVDKTLRIVVGIGLLGLCGIAPVRTSMVGLVGVAGSREKWLRQAAALGRRAD